MTDKQSRTLTRTDWLLIGVLLALVLPLRLWLLYNTEVTARDSIGYIRYALQFERLPWQEVWQKNHQHPGYPLCVLLVSLPVRAFDGGEPTPENMELSTQLVNLPASLLLMLPMYVLGRQFFDRIISFSATLLYQYLPVSAQHLSDGISEPTYLVLLVSGLLAMVCAIRERSIWSCVWCGVFSGLAYLVRPEGLLIVPAFGLALIVVQCCAEWRLTRRRFLACGAAMVLTAMLVGSIYVGVTGRITNKLSALETLRNGWKVITTPFTSPREANAGGNGSVHLFAASFVPSDNKAIRVWQSVAAYSKEVFQGLHYVTFLTALLGFWWSFPALKRQPGFWALLIYALVHSFILIALAMSAYYVSDRHVMILVLGGTFFIVIGLREFPRRALSWLQVDAPDAELVLTPVREKWYRSPPVWFAILFATLIVCCLPRATQRLHGTRVGNHQAGLWLAERVGADDVIEDDHGWSHFFSGLVFHEGKEPALPEDHRSKCYVVTTRSRDPEIDARRQAAILRGDATPVYRWPEGDVAKARVIVHAQPRNFKTHPWRIAAPQ